MLLKSYFTCVRRTMPLRLRHSTSGALHPAVSRTIRTRVYKHGRTLTKERSGYCAILLNCSNSFVPVLYVNLNHERFRPLLSWPHLKRALWGIAQHMNSTIPHVTWLNASKTASVGDWTSVSFLASEPGFLVAFCSSLHVSSPFNSVHKIVDIGDLLERTDSR